jgi:AraC family transcriptional activator of pobA
LQQISTYNISKLSNIFAVADNQKDFLLIDETKYTPSTEEPFRTDTYAIGFLKKGTLNVTAGLSAGIIKGPAILTIGPYVIRSIEKADDQPQIELIFFKENFFLQNQSNIFYLLKYPFFENSDSHITSLDTDKAEKFTIIFDLLKKITGSGHLHEADIIRNYISILLCEIDAASKYKKENINVSKTSVLLANFKTLLSKEVLQERSVKFYAGKLNVTPKYLSEVIKEQTGRTAGEWIDQTVILEAKVLLQKKDLSIFQVSEMLNFSDQSVFGKFFKVNTGIPPLTYRNSLV